MKVDGYIRVSSRNGRSGASFISPDVQRETIERLARAKGLELGEVVEEIDVKGSVPVEQRELGRLIRKIEDGESGGLVVWKVSRYSRSQVDGILTAQRIREAGGNIIGDDLDTSAPNGRAMLGFLLGWAEEELDQRREGWAQARSRAVKRGVPNGRAPLGYRKRPDGRLEVVERQAAKVREAFRLRAEGEPFAAIGRRYGWSHTTASQILSNVAYLGVARSGDYVNEHAHPPIVERDLWDAAQATRTRTPAATGELTAKRILQGLARCGGCGRTLKVVHRKRQDGSRVSAYFCKDAATESCSERAYVHADALEEHVAAFFTDALATAPRLVDVVAVGRELEAAQAELADAEAELTAFVELGAALKREHFQRGYAAREVRVEEVHERVRHLSARLPRIPAGGSLVKLWDTFDAAERRDVLAGFLGRVVVSRGASRDLAGNVRIEWSDGSVADDEGRIGEAAA